jgi:hypothetical protein
MAGLNLPQGEWMLSMMSPVMGSFSASHMRSTDSTTLTDANTASGSDRTLERKYSRALASKA